MQQSRERKQFQLDQERDRLRIRNRFDKTKPKLTNEQQLHSKIIVLEKKLKAIELIIGKFEKEEDKFSQAFEKKTILYSKDIKKPLEDCHFDMKKYIKQAPYMRSQHGNDVSFYHKVISKDTIDFGINHKDDGDYANGYEGYPRPNLIFNYSDEYYVHAITRCTDNYTNYGANYSQYHIVYLSNYGKLYSINYKYNERDASSGRIWTYNFKDYNYKIPNSLLENVPTIVCYHLDTSSSQASLRNICYSYNGMTIEQFEMLLELLRCNVNLSNMVELNDDIIKIQLSDCTRFIEQIKDITNK